LHFLGRDEALAEIEKSLKAMRLPWCAGSAARAKRRLPLLTLKNIAAIFARHGGSIWCGFMDGRLAVSASSRLCRMATG
jgi:hypothetical protein